METTTWICDTCTNEIQKAEDGWVEWLLTKESPGIFKGRGLRVVHRRAVRNGCQYDLDAEGCDEATQIEDLELSDLTGPNGLNLLLSMIAEPQLPTEQVLEMIKRVHIPGYERARPHFTKAISEIIIEPNLPPGYYWQHEIEAVIKAVENGEL